MVIIDNFIVYMEDEHWNYRLIYFSSVFALVVLLINAYFLLTEHKITGNLEHRVNQIAKLEFFLLFASGIFMYAFPDSFFLSLKNSNNSYRSIARGCAAMVIAASFQALFVSEFCFSSDKKIYMKSRLFGHIFEPMAIFIGYYILRPLQVDGEYVLVHVLSNLSYGLLFLYGFLITPTNDMSKRQ